jgi:hypothetical protein
MKHNGIEIRIIGMVVVSANLFEGTDKETTIGDKIDASLLADLPVIQESIQRLKDRIDYELNHHE